MFCEKCGSEMDKDKNFCSDCGASVVPTASGEKIQLGLVLAIVTTVLCCLPFGIVAIVYAVKVNDLVANGRITEAQEAAKQSKKWSQIGIVIGLIAIIAQITILLLGSAVTTVR